MVNMPKLIDPDEYKGMSDSRLQCEIEYLEFIYTLFEFRYVRPARDWAELVGTDQPVYMPQKRIEKYRIGLLAFLEVKRRLSLATAEILVRLDDTSDSAQSSY